MIDRWIGIVRTDFSRFDREPSDWRLYLSLVLAVVGAVGAVAGAGAMLQDGICDAEEEDDQEEEEEDDDDDDILQVLLQINKLS